MFSQLCKVNCTWLALNVLSVLPNIEGGVTPKRFKIFQSFNGSYMLLRHLVLGSRTYLLLHKCTTLNYVVEKSTFTELLSLLPKRTVGVDIAKKYRQLQNTSHFKRNLLPHSSFSHVHIIASMAIANLWIMELPRIEKSNLVNWIICLHYFWVL